MRNAPSAQTAAEADQLRAQERQQKMDAFAKEREASSAALLAVLAEQRQAEEARQAAPAADQSTALESAGIVNRRVSRASGVAGLTAKHLTTSQIRQKLRQAGVDIPEGATRTVLQGLLDGLPPPQEFI